MANNKSDVEQSTKLAVLMSSDWPGAGLTTVSQEIANSLDLERVPAAGQVRRAIAHHWQTFLIRHQNDRAVEPSPQSLWFEFTAAYRLAYDLALHKNDPTALQALLKPHLHATVSTIELAALTTAQVEHGAQSIFLDVIPDLVAYVTFQRHSDKPGFIHEGKLAFAFDRLLQKLSRGTMVLLEELPEQSLAIVRIILTVQEEESARRVLGREITQGKRVVPLSISQEDHLTWYYHQIREIMNLNQTRINGVPGESIGDYQRYEKTYGVTQAELEAISQEAEIIDTSDLSIEQVVTQILQIIAIQAPEFAPIVAAVLDNQVDNTKKSD